MEQWRSAHHVNHAWINNNAVQGQMQNEDLRTIRELGKPRLQFIYRSQRGEQTLTCQRQGDEDYSKGNLDE